MVRKTSKQDGAKARARLEDRLREIDQKLDHIIYRLWEEDPRTSLRRRREGSSNYETNHVDYDRPKKRKYSQD